MRLNDYEAMYNAAYANDTVGWPGLLFPMKWFAKKSFKVIEDQCLVQDKDEVLFTFMMLADTSMFGRPIQSGMMNRYEQGGYQQEIDQTGHRHWTAFALTKRGSSCHLYYARWVPFSSDFGDMPISNQDVNIDIDQQLLPLHTKMDISTLRKCFMNMTNKKRSISFIRNAIYDTLDSVNSHKESEDGRRIYDQFTSSYDEGDENDE